MNNLVQRTHKTGQPRPTNRHVQHPVITIHYPSTIKWFIYRSHGSSYLTSFSVIFKRINASIGTIITHMTYMSTRCLAYVNLAEHSTYNLHHTTLLKTLSTNIPIREVKYGGWFKKTGVASITGYLEIASPIRQTSNLSHNHRTT